MFSSKLKFTSTEVSRQNQKLSPKFYGPYEIIEKIGSVAYRFKLPVGAQIHPVIYVSQLKRKVGNDLEVSV